MPGTRAKVHIYESEYKAIVAATREFPDDETGGDLFGTFTHGGMPVIWLASGPGPQVRRNRVHFEQDSAFMTFWERRLGQGFGLQYIGSWHSHHRLGLREPSTGDRESARTYARNHSRQRTLEIIVTYEGHQPRLWPYFYPNAQDGRWIDSEFNILAGASPMRTHLGADEAAFSGGADWRQVQFVHEMRTQRTADRSLPAASNYEQDSQGQEEQDEGVEIPEEIQNEIEAIANNIRDVSQVGGIFSVRVATKKGRQFDILIDVPSRYIVRVELIDPLTGKARDITGLVQQKVRFPLYLYRQGGNTLKMLLGELASLELPEMSLIPTPSGSNTRPLDRGEGAAAPGPFPPAQSQAEEPAAARSPSLSQAGSERRDQRREQEAAAATRGGSAEAGQAIRIQATHMNDGISDESFKVTMTVWGDQAYTTLVKSLRRPFRETLIEKNQEGKAFTGSAVIQSWDDLKTIFKKLGENFDSPSYEFDDYIKQQLDQEGIAKDNQAGDETFGGKVKRWLTGS